MSRKRTREERLLGMLPQQSLFGFTPEQSEQVLKDIMDTYQTTLFAYAFQLCGNYDAAHDILQRAWLELFVNLSQLGEEGVYSSNTYAWRMPFQLPSSVLGIDDFSFRRGGQFGTILVDLESSESWTSYLIVRRKRRRPGCASAQISWRRDRDRGREYASAAREVAPQATQYTDGFHLLKNLKEAFHSQIYKHTRRTRHVSYRRIF
jgi:hypothetical protein